MEEPGITDIRAINSQDGGKVPDITDITAINSQDRGTRHNRYKSNKQPRWRNQT